MTCTLLLETTALSRPGRERGLGRYTRHCRDAAQTLEYDVREITLPLRSGRLSEFVDLADRSRRLAAQDFVIFHATNPHTLAVTRRPIVASILDVIPLDVPSHRRTGLKAELFLRLAARADSILTLSSFSKARIVDRLGADPRRVFVAPLPPAPAFTPEPQPPTRHRPNLSEDAEEGYVSALVDLSTPDPRKRGDWIAPLANHLHARGLRLAVAGAGTENSPSIGIATGLGRVSDCELADLYRQSVAFVYFSSYEGQGLPPLEAMATGVPAVAVANSAVSEVVGGGGILVHPAGSASADEDVIVRLADECARLRDDPQWRAEVSTRSLSHVVSHFTSKSFANGLIDAYQHARASRR